MYRVDKLSTKTTEDGLILYTCTDIPRSINKGREYIFLDCEQMAAAIGISQYFFLQVAENSAVQFSFFANSDGKRTLILSTDEAQHAIQSLIGCAGVTNDKAINLSYLIYKATGENYQKKKRSISLNNL